MPCMIYEIGGIISLSCMMMYSSMIRVIVVQWCPFLCKNELRDKLCSMIVGIKGVDFKSVEWMSWFCKSWALPSCVCSFSSCSCY